MRRITALLAFFAVAAASAIAQEAPPTPVAEVGMAFSSATFHPGSGTPSFTALGGSGTVVLNVNNVLGVVADLGAYHNGADANFSPTTFSYLFGPRLNFRRSKLVPYVQTLFGGARVSSSLVDPNSGATVSEKGFAAAFGGGMDVRLSDHIAVKPFQLEYLMTRLPNIWSSNNIQNNLRYSAGVVFTFGSR